MRSLTVSPMAAASRRYPSAFLAKWALYVFDPATCQYLKHRQLCRQSNLGPIWDSSYSNKLGRLCQGVSKGPTSTGQLVKGTDTFCVIHFSDIPCDRLKVITVTKVVCNFFFEKEIPIAQASPSWATKSSTPAMPELKPPPSIFENLCSTVYYPSKDPILSPTTSATTTHQHHSNISNT